MASPGDQGTPSTARHDHDHDHDQLDDGGPASKKRRTGPNSRGVANLTPEQLARKRANDREAQRAIRERTKNQIDRLQQRIRDLESQQPYHDLQLVLRDKDAVQAENADIRKRLESVLSIIQPIVRPAAGLNELAAAAEQSPLPAPPLPPPPPPPPAQHSLPLPLPHRDTPTQPVQPAVVDPRHYHSTLNDIAAASPQNGTQSPGLADGARPWMYPGQGPTSHMRRYSNSPPFEPPRPSQIQAPEMPFDERLGVDFLLDNGQRRAVDPNLPPPQQPQPTNVSCNSQAQYAPSLIPHLTLPRNTQPSCPLDKILLDFLQDRQSRAAEGVPIRTLVGPLYPNFTSLVYPERNVESHPLSQLFTDILRTFPDICGKPEQVAIVFIMFLIMRWQIEPTQENYDRLPHWVTPRPSQLFVGHPCWFDHLPWPKLRDRLVITKPFISFENFFIPFTTTVSLNWPYEPHDVLLPASKVTPKALSSSTTTTISSPFSTHVNTAGSPATPATPNTPTTLNAMGLPAHLLPKEEDQWLINPAFETHLRDLANWSLGPSFGGTFPAFADCVKIKMGR